MKLLTLDERLALASRAARRAGDVPVVATANMERNIANHVEELKRMEETGVSGVILVPPLGMAVNQDELEQYYSQMADQASVPVFLYEYPGSEPGNISAKVYENLARNGRVRGIKDTTCTMEGILAKINAAPDSIVYQANTPFMLDSIRNGARGIMAIISTACSELVIEMWDKAQAGDSSAAAAHQLLVYLDAVLNNAYTATAKYLLQLQGLHIDVHTRSQARMNDHAVKAMEVWYEAFLRYRDGMSKLSSKTKSSAMPSEPATRLRR